MTALPSRVHFNEVVARDGLQNEARFVPTADKIALVDALSDCGFARIEVTAFVSPKAIPPLADAQEVMQGIRRQTGVCYAVLVPNARGAARALDARADAINFVMSASESHNQSNLRMPRERSLAALAEVLAVTAGQAEVQVSISTAFGCPMEGAVDAQEVLRLAARIAGLGAGAVRALTLCDTTGMAHPAQVTQLVALLRARLPQLALTLHFHDTRGMALANMLAGLQAGVTRFDAALGGLGGCPYAPGASGNACTEDAVHMFAAMGLDTGVDLARLLPVSRRLPELVGHAIHSQVARAGPLHTRHPAPAHLA